MANLFKQTTIYALLFVGLLFNACVKDITEKIDEPDKPDPGGNQQSTSGIPDDVDYSTFDTRKLTVKVMDEYDGNHYYTIEVYDENPFFSPTASLLVPGGKTNKNTPFITELVFPKTLKNIFIRQTDPYGYRMVRSVAIPEGDIVLDFGAPTKAASTTRASLPEEPNVSVDYNQFFKKGLASATEIKDVEYKLKAGGTYKITASDYSGDLVFPEGKFTLYIDEGRTLSLSNKDYIVTGGAEIYILQGATLSASADVDVKNGAKIYNAGTVKISDLEVEGASVLYNHPGGKIKLNNLEMNGGSVRNFCLIDVANELELYGTLSDITLAEHSSLISGQFNLKTQNTSMLNMLATSLFETNKLNREKGGRLSVNGDVTNGLSHKDFPLFKVNGTLDWGDNYEIEFHWNIGCAAQKVIGRDNGIPQFEVGNFPMHMEGECYGKQYVPDEDKEPTEDSKDPEYNQDSNQTLAYTYMFEDNWPALGDYDMNDLVIDVSIANTMNGGNATAVTLTTTIRAVGATKALYAYAQIEAPGAELMVVPLFTGEAHAAMGYAQEQMINTFSYTCEPKTETLSYSLPATTRGAVTARNLNVFVVWGDINAEQWNEVHLPGYAGTKKAAGSDANNKYKYLPTGENAKPEYGNMMWALMIPAKYFVSYPKEGSSIMQAYSGFEKWAQAGGNDNIDWYTNPSDKSLIYQGK